MKAYDIIQQLYAVMPSQTSLFTTDVPITSLSKSGTTVSLTTSAAHGLSTGDFAYVTGANWRTPIASITRNRTVATVVCSSPHDLTESFFDTVTLVDGSTSAFNGTFKLLSVPNRKTFTMQVPDFGPIVDTGSAVLLEPWRAGLNGWVQVVSTGANSLTYTSSGSDTVTASGTMRLRKRPRISGAASLERAEAAYTRMGSNELWAFVVMGQVTASKSKYTQTDFISSSTGASTFRQNLANDVFIYVFVPTADSLSARAERDLMTDVSKFFFKSLLGKTFPTYFADEPVTTMHFLRHRQLDYRGAYYIHEFQFEGVSEITANDIVEPVVTRAFRDLVLDFSNEFEQVLVHTNVNLDDQPTE